MLAIVQFSSIAEDDRRGLPATRSLRTEQRFGKAKPCAIESGRHFRNAGGRLCPSADSWLLLETNPEQEPYRAP